jgi:hypothetical protein
MVSSSSSMRSSTADASPPRSRISTRISCAFWEPTRHGTHLPQDSTRKKFSTLVAAASRSVPSASTTIAPVPRAEPAFAIASNVSGRSTQSGPRKFVDAPPGCTAATSAPSRTPPASAIRSETSEPAGTQNTPGASTWPESEKNFNPSPPLTPWAFHHAAPRSRMIGTAANVSTLFISVG